MIKSGTNQLHGTVYEFLRNNNFDARPYFAPSTTPYHQNQFGFTIGGPVLIPKIYSGKTRTFWFFNYEGNRIRQGNTSFQIVPTPAMVAGDLSKTLTGARPISWKHRPLESEQIVFNRLREPMVSHQPDSEHHK